MIPESPLVVFVLLTMWVLVAPYPGLIGRTRSGRFQGYT